MIGKSVHRKEPIIPVCHARPTPLGHQLSITGAELVCMLKRAASADVKQTFEKSTPSLFFAPTNAVDRCSGE